MRKRSALAREKMDKQETEVRTTTHPSLLLHEGSMNREPLTEFAADLALFAEQLTKQSQDLYTRFGYREEQNLAAIINKLTVILETASDENENSYQPAPYKSQQQG